MSYLLDNKELMKDWDYKKNKNIELASLTHGSNKCVWWKCSKCGFEWNTKVCNRASTLARGCPSCSRAKAAINNSLTRAKKHNIAQDYPNIAAEWHPTRNGELTPNKISYGSEKSVWWKCSWCKTEWQSKINKRTTRGYGCPKCSKSSTSYPEQAIYYYIKLYFPDAVNRDVSFGMELDIYIPSINTGIEYDGYKWHNSKAALKKDNDKDKKCLDKSIKLFRLRDSRLTKTNSATNIFCKDGEWDELSKTIEMLLLKLGVTVLNHRIKIIEDIPNILSLYRRNIREKSLGFLYPDIAKEWHPTKNEELLPENIYARSGHKVWWKCSKCGYEWQTSPNHRTRKTENNHTIGCPKCAIKNVSNCNKVQIINLDTKEIFNSLTEAAESVGGKKSSLCGHLNGKAKTFLGYHWDYVDKSKRRRKTFKGKIKNLDKNIIFENSKSAAKWCNGDLRTINRCCNGVIETAYGYHWEYIQ